MSFYSQGFPYHHPAAHAYPGRRGPFHHAPAQHPSYNYTHPSPPAYHPHEDYYAHYAGAPYAYHDGGDIDEEERAAIAHLKAIQRRREAASARQTREAELRVERELAFQAAIQREREARERAVEREKERQRAIEVAREERERAIRRRREAAQAEARAEAFQALKARAIQAAKAKAYAIAQAQAQNVARQAAVAAQEKKRQYFQAVQAEQARRRACGARCARFAEKEVKKDEGESKQDDGLKVINDLLGGLFGINVALDDTPAPAAATESKPAPAPATATEKKESTTAAPEAKTNVEPAKEAEKPAETKEAKKDDTAAFPAEINDLLSHFLGLRVDPATGNESTTGQPNKDVVNGLNRFLGQFGLEFEPSPAAESNNATASGSGSTSPPAPAPVAEASTKTDAPKSTPADESKSTPTPIANFLNGHYDIPPFVRDILSNVEVALTQGQDFTPEPEVKGKGKGVAEGEKTARPAPTSTPVPDVVVESATPAESTDSTSSTASIAKLDNISHELFLATESFEFPSKLTFAHPAETTEVIPQLLFNKTNSGYHAQAHKLLQLLLAADGISSGGDKDVRRKRKEVVRAVEGAIEALEKKRDELWDEVKVKRDNGEESEDESTSSAASTTSDIEHAELYETIPDEAAPTQPKTDDKPEEAGEVVFDATEHEAIELAEAPEVEENSEVVQDKLEETTTAEEKADTPAENKVEAGVEEKDDQEVKPTGSSTPRSVTVEDQEEGYEVL